MGLYKMTQTAAIRQAKYYLRWQDSAPQYLIGIYDATN